MADQKYQSLFDLSGRVVVLTGGGGYLGAQFANASATHGASVAVDGAGNVYLGRGPRRHLRHRLPGRAL